MTYNSLSMSMLVKTWYIYAYSVVSESAPSDIGKIYVITQDIQEVSGRKITGKLQVVKK